MPLKNSECREDGAERPRLPRAVMDRCSRPGPEPTTLEAVGNQWRYTLVVVQAREEEGNVLNGVLYGGYKNLHFSTSMTFISEMAHGYRGSLSGVHRYPLDLCHFRRP